jgi:1-acyl-sn-glycerol-3-phosphate acyltransferase
MPGADLIDWAAYSATYWAAVGSFTLGWGFRATGRRHMPPTGPVLIASNHQSFMDPVLIGAAATRRLTYLARSTLFDNPALAAVIRHYGAVPIDRGFGKEGLQTVLGELTQGRAVLMFPEGERTHDGRLQPLKPGVSLLVKRVTCPIVPAAVAGVFDAWPRHKTWPTPDPLVLPCQGRSITVAFGPPIDPARYKGMDREGMLADLSAKIGEAHATAERVRRRG